MKKLLFSTLIVFFFGLTANAVAPRFAELTPLQRHLAFFAKEESGNIKAKLLLKGFQQLGLSMGEALIIASALFVGLGGGLIKKVPLASVISFELGGPGLYDARGLLREDIFECSWARFSRQDQGESYLPRDELRSWLAIHSGDWCSHILKTEHLKIDGVAYLAKLCGFGERITRQQLHDFYDGTLLFKRTGRPLPFGGLP